MTEGMHFVAVSGCGAGQWEKESPPAGSTAARLEQAGGDVVVSQEAISVCGEGGVEQWRHMREEIFPAFDAVDIIIVHRNPYEHILSKFAEMNKLVVPGHPVD